MRIPKKDVPQANTFQFVLSTVENVAQGATTDRAIAARLGRGLDPRQGRYYRRAAEIFGFIQNVERNRAVLTPLGKQFVHASGAERAQMAAEAVLRARIIQRVVPFLESKGTEGASRKDLERFIAAVTEPTTGEMIRRRLSTILSWLDAVGIVRQSRSGVVLESHFANTVPAVEYAAMDEPLSPHHYDLQAYEQVSRRAKEAKGYLTVLIDEAARERANDAHRMLTDLVARKIAAAGVIPKYNKYIDMSALVRDTPYLFEMKSTHSRNAHDQVRTAISQLYEYRYLQDMPTAKLVVVIQNPLPREKRWLVDYVTQDRQMLIAWDGDQAQLHCPDSLRQDLGFLVN